MKISNLIKTAMVVVVVEAALCMVAAGNAQAEQCQLVTIINSHATTVKQFESRKLFESAQFSQLESTLEKRYRESLNSDGGDFLMLHDMNNMVQGNTDTDTDKLINMWINQYPQSFFAQLSAGIFYINQAATARGVQFISETSEKQLTKMNEINSKAIDYVQKAMQLNPRSALPHSLMIDIAGVEGQAVGKNVEEWLKIANQVDPKNLSARTQAIDYLSPRWGGSFELLDQMVQQSKKLLSPQSVRYLEFSVIMGKANHEEIITQDNTKAYKLYKQAKGICENSESAQKGILRTSQPEDDDN